MTTYTYTNLIDPSAAPGGSTSPLSINDRGQVVGNYYNGTATEGFLYSDGTWTTLSDPSAASGGTIPASINDRGQITGSYFNGTTNVGFLYSNGTWTTLSDPSAAPGGGTSPGSINDRGQVIGSYFNGTTDVGFLYSNGTWTTLSDPSARANPGPSGIKGFTDPQSINDAGQVTGFYYNGTSYQTFLYSDGTYTNLSDPSVGANVPTTAASINDAGQVTGVHINGTFPPGYFPTGFIYSGGAWTELVDPSVGANGTTWPVSINDRGQVAGYFYQGSTESTLPIEGFIYSNGSWTTLKDPASGANGQTIPISINNAGQVLGYYDFYNASTQSVTEVGFIATPTDLDKAREPPKLTITDHSLSLSAGGTIPLPISVKANDSDDTVSVKISGVPSFDTITAGDGHAVAKKGDSYTFTEADVASGLTLHSSHGADRHHDVASLTVTASNTTAGEAATSAAQTLKIKDSAREAHDHHHAALFDQYVAAGFHNDHDGAGQMSSSPDKQGHQENLAFLSSPHH